MAYLQELLGVFLGKTRETRRFTTDWPLLHESNQLPKRFRTIQVPKRLPNRAKKVRNWEGGVSRLSEKTYVVVDFEENSSPTLPGQFVKVGKNG